MGSMQLQGRKEQDLPDGLQAEVMPWLSIGATLRDHGAQSQPDTVWDRGIVAS